MAFSGFGKPFFSFFTELAANNEKAWFEDNRARYENDVKATIADFIIDMAPRLAKISPHFVADPKKSMFRIHRDVRFSRDKSPYKTNAGIQFRHAAGKDAHAPGFYIHLEPGRVFYGGGLWKPPSDKLGQIRDAIVESSAAWKRAKGNKAFQATFGGLSHGDPLTRAPKGYAPDHPLIDDLKRRSFFAMKEDAAKAAGRAAFLDDVEAGFKAAKPVMKFLAKAVDAPF